MTTILIILTAIVAFLLILIIMVQNPKGGGISSTFGGGMNIGGVQSTNTFLDKSTWTLAAVMVALILITNLTHPSRHGGAAKSNIENTLDEAELPAEQADAPATPAKPATETPAQEQPAK
jgi:preprotein translocase subunit SecG